MIQKKANFKNLVRIDNLVDGGQAVSRLSVVPNTDLVAAPVFHLINNQRIEGINDMATVFTPVTIYKVEKPTVKKYELPRLEVKE